MPLNVGEVEASLTTRDNMSPAMQLAAARVAELEYKLGTLGTSSVAAFDVMNARLAVAKERYEQLSVAATGATDAMKENGAVTQATGASMEQVEGIATRMMTRFILLAAIRGAVKFTTDLFENADALMKMSDNLEVSTTKLQEWQYAAERTGTPMTALTGAVDELGKKLAGGKESVVDALDTLGLSYEQLWEMNPEKRFDTVATAVGNIEDRLTRTGIEVALFGTDKIDGLTRHLAELEEQAIKTGKVLGPDTVQQLASTTQIYKDMYSNIKNIAGEWIVAAQNWVAYNSLLNSNAGRAMMDGEDISGNDPTDAARLISNNVQEPKLSLPKQLPKAPLDPDSKEGAAALKAADEFLKKQAEMAIAAEAAADRYAKAWETAQKYVADLWVKDETSFEKLSKAKTTIEDNEFKERERQDLAYNKNRLERGTINDQQFFDHKAQIERTYWDRHNETLKKNEELELSGISNKEQKELNLLDEKYAKGQIDESQYQEARLAITEDFANQRLAVEDQFNSNMDIRRKQELDKEIADKKAAAKQIAEDQKKQQKEDDAAKKKQENLDMGGSTEVNRGNLAQEANYWNIPADAAFAMAERGFSLQEIISAWQNDMVAQWKPAGPRIPGFKEGGTVDIVTGEHGPEAMRVPLGTQVAPTGSSFGSSGSVVNNFYINGTAEESARKISDILIKQAKSSRMFRST